MEINKKRKRIILIIILLIIFLVIITCFLITNKSNSNEVDITQNNKTEPTESTEETETSKIIQSCAPEFTGGKVSTSTNTETTWSYYYTDATSQNVAGYVANLKNNGFVVTSEKTIASTSFWDIKKGSCYVTLRYHAPDNGVILEVKSQ
jgi:ABC-type glycerol-3-phosphate transport system permease component